MSADAGRRHRAWSAALDAGEQWVAQARASLESGGPMPGAGLVAFPEVPPPGELDSRARLLSVAQRDLEIALRERVAILGAAMCDEPAATRTAIALYFDRSA